ncbi:dipeptide ABC transporter ATP-binding protein [Hungatella hathewayi]|uniref:Dipeptide ABC transporter ATP-binding protein n=2 Tax=Lachnospiraceae TaxID=186803 RepID=A0A374P4T3_9FIRM|nr:MULTISPECIES: dipeptide ABC transporter ATP-binding protein [Hungatella]MBC5703413.1 dipeptide ABC transporter ATP-binding protein [Hungatella sp. L36]MBS5242757.1 dipeptide ABC transporter ATP-binding protein [Hungatella hathewayi]RGJ01653.1 dipeptide ABC transporter ATP-binding protein [Hungatella hathewayi]RGK97624.1 dipeptide ABC transporter ATP-binding protein [Hungatella hathewayi]RGO73938.1 dipeptide ABC transporter ATP-binding protein [Hungatella hathewayi]
MKKEPILKVEHLKMYFPLTKGFMKKTGGVVKAVDDISFSVEKGKTLGIVGESGCGKTTTGKCILQINKPTEGKILYEGQDLITMDRSRLKDCRRDIQMIFQDPFGSLDPRQKAFSIIREVLVEEDDYHGADEVKNKVNELLVKVGLSEEMGERYPHEMSGGQRQRLGIARALACDPKIIICDEPVSALDVSIQAQIINLFKELQREMGLTYIFVAHDLAVVRHIADVIAVMYLGRIMEMMEAVELYKNPMHPYSQALLSAIPIVDYYEEQKRERILLKGEVPSPIHAPSGCPFHPRCPYASEKCRTAPPELKDLGNGHYVACYHVDKN